MAKFVTQFFVLIALAGCGDPLRNVEKLSDVDIAPSAALVEIAESAESVPGSDDSVLTPPPGLSEPVADTAETEAGEPRKKGLLGFLRRSADRTKADEPATAEVSDVPVTEADVPDDVAVTAVPDDAIPTESSTEVAALLPGAVETPAPARKGFLSVFRGGKNDKDGISPARRTSSGPKPGAPDYRQVGPGVTLPFGELARLCGVSAGKLGKKVAKFPERGRGYTLYDSAPDETAPHNLYITGFDDGCARQFTAAFALFGPAQTHEFMRYSLPENLRPYSDTDNAYEKLKRRICGIGKGKPCGAKLERVGKTTVFVSAYERYGDNSRWKNLLLHDGGLVAADLAAN